MGKIRLDDRIIEDMSGFERMTEGKRVRKFKHDDRQESKRSRNSRNESQRRRKVRKMKVEV